MSNPVGPMEMLTGVKAVLDALPTAGRVVIDPIIVDTEEQYVAFVEQGDNADGWLVGVGPEDPPKRVGDGAEQWCTLLLLAIVRSGRQANEASRTYFDTKIVDAKKAFSLSANENLGIVHEKVWIRQGGLYAPDGYFPRNWKEWIHHTGRLEMRVWQRWC